MLATGLTTSPDSRVFTLPLRTDVSWHDGKPFGAEDVAFTIDYYRKHDSVRFAGPLAVGDTVQVHGVAARPWPAVSLRQPNGRPETGPRSPSPLRPHPSARGPPARRGSRRWPGARSRRRRVRRANGSAPRRHNPTPREVSGPRTDSARRSPCVRSHRRGGRSPRAGRVRGRPRTLRRGRCGASAAE
ncbi:ABC transporter substrate-binding protein [Micromonospora sp. NBC_01699]|uniref:ABC transporter substrate-binding protein n=1 Tax=Micromonospora sp. NBC_01699 TaxID=2975984 RepID=UPI003FA525D0